MWKDEVKLNKNSNKLHYIGLSTNYKGWYFNDNLQLLKEKIVKSVTNKYSLDSIGNKETAVQVAMNERKTTE